MDATYYNFNNGFGGYNYGVQPVNYNTNVMQQPQFNNALSEEEIKILQNSRPQKLDINISTEDNLRSMCTHKHNGRDMVQRINDGTGDVYCPICGERWNSDQRSKEEIEDCINTLISAMQNSKWVGDFSPALVRDYYPMIPLLKKYPEIHEYSMQQFNRYFNQNGYNYANEANVYAQFNSLNGFNQPSYNYAQPQPVYGQMMAAPVYGQPQQPAPAYGQPATMNNPMQAPVYGVNPQAPNNQFVNQANMMMGGSVNTYAPAQAYAPQQPVQATGATTVTQGEPTVAPTGEATTEATVQL